MWCARVWRLGGGCVWVVGKGGEGKILGGWIQTRGLSVSWKRLCVSSRWTIVCWVLGSGCWELSRVAYSLSHTSPLCPQPWAFCCILLCLPLSFVPQCIWLLFISSNTKYRFFSPKRGHRFFFCSVCVILCWGTSWKVGCDRRRMLSLAAPASLLAVPP